MATMLRTVVVLLVLLVLTTPAGAEDGSSGLSLEPRETEQLGGDRDDHGCLPAAGYAWCETLADCVRAWETPCPPSACGVDLYRDATTGNCSSLTVCNTTELEVVAPTATSDRVCRCHSWAAWTWLDVAWRVAAILFLFCGIAVICDDYFTPALEGIVEAWDLSEDVAGATFMAAGSSAPELFTSLIAVFAPHEPCTADTEGVGVGTIVGSAIFNVLIIIGLSAVLGCAPGQPLKLDWKPLLRDTIFYVLAIVLLVVCLMDGKVWWHEALTMLSLYVCYIVFMRFNERVCYPNGRLAQIQDEENGTVGAAPQDTSEEKAELVAGSETPRSDAEQSVDVNTTEGNTHRHWSHSLSWVYRSPWTLAFKCTVPDPEERYMAGFFSSIMWIAVLCYFMVEWSVDVAQMVQMTPAIMAFTVLAAGTSIPDALESVIVAKQGKGDMAVSNALGSNIFDILFGLSVPYFLVNMQHISRSEPPPVTMCVKDLEIYLALLLITLSFTVGAIGLQRFELGRGLGYSLLALYLAVVVCAILRDYDFIVFGDKC